MNRSITGDLRAKAIALAASLGLMGLAAAQANAGCMDNVLQKLAPNKSWNPAYIVPAVYRPDSSDAAPMQINDSNDNPAIVGLWEFKLAGFLTDFGTQAFHAGGTETIFSGGVDPATGDVCQGVWRKVGHSTYTLNHIAMAWTAPGAQYGVLIHIHMALKVGRSGNSLTGNYTVAIFASSPEDPFNESAGPFASGTGTLTATRLIPD